MHLIFMKCQENYLFVIRNPDIVYTKYKYIVMKLFYLIGFLTLSGVLQANTLSGQDLSKIFVSLQLKNTSLKETLRQIERHTKIRFSYKSEDISGLDHITYQKKDQQLDEVLRELLGNTHLTYEEVSPNVLIIRKKSVVSRVPESSALEAQISIKGKVTDEAGVPLPGVSILVKGSTTGASSGKDGSYTLNVAQGSGTLVASFVGYIKQEVSFSGAGNYDIRMVTDANALSEVVVIGYGTTTKKDLTGSVGQVAMTDLKKAPVFTFTEALAGRVAGVQVSTNDGQPGSAQEIVIRGSGSLTQSTAPLYVIDGFAMESFQSNSLNPDDIESITVLKDASGTAIYGARGSNGVVVIQTKKGKTGKAVITVNSSLGVQELKKQMEMMSPYEFVKTQSEMINTNLVNQVYFPDGKTLDDYKNVAGVNWQDLIFRRGAMQTHNMAIRGGTEQTKYSVSGVINDQDALMINSGYNRALARISLDQDVSNKIKVGFNANYSSATSFGLAAASNTGTASISNYIFANVYGYRPVAADNTSLEEELFDPDVNVDASNVRINPVITAQNTHRKTNNTELIGNAYLSYALTKDLSFNTRGGYRKRVVRGEGFYNSLTPQGSASPVNTRGVNGNISFAENNTWTNENTLTYQKAFHTDHKLTALGGFSLEGAGSNTYGATSQFLPNEQLGMLGLDEGTPLSVAASGGNYTLMSFFSRLDYNYRSKYLLTFTIRADGSSKFRNDNRWGYFPSAAFAWNMANESFMKQVPVISNAKLRLSHGVSGNNRIGNYATYHRISFDNRVNGVSFNNSTPLTSAWLSELGNEGLKWESIALTNIGYDLGLFNNRVELTADIYRKTTNDLLLDAQIPYISGYASTTKNIGKIKNEGLELTLSTVNINTSSFRWESSFNISFNRSKILELTESSTLFSDVSGGFSPAPALWAAKVGQPISVFHGYVFDGVYQYEDFDSPSAGVYNLKPNVPSNGNTRASIRPGDIKYRDLNGDLAVTAFDQTVIGRPEPVHTGGFSNNFSYKGLSLNVFFQWSAGNDIFNGNRLIFEGNAQYAYHTNQFASWADRWSPENPTNKNFRVGGQGPTARGSSRVIEDGSYLRLKTMSLGYQVPVRYINKLYLKNLSLNVSAQNLLTWTKYSGLDPEVSVRNSALTRGFDYSAYPHAQTLVFGLNATF